MRLSGQFEQGLSSLRSLSDALASTSRIPARQVTPSASSPFHTSSTCHVFAQRTPRQRKAAKLKKQRNQDTQELKRRLFEASKPDPILGHQLNAKGESLWKECELAGLLLDRDVVWGIKEDRRGNLVPISELEDLPESVKAAREEERLQAEREGGPLRLNFGLTLSDRKTLFGHLPTIVAEDNVLNAHALQLSRGDSGALKAAEEDLERMEEAEKVKSDTLSRILDLRNASAKGIQVENIRRIIDHFGNRGPRLPRDTGSVEVQAAVLTYRIRSLLFHLNDGHRKDHSNRRSMSNLVQQRAKLLKYLFKKDQNRFEAILPRVGLEARAVLGEVIVPGMPKVRRA
ncbi:hypothetical protein IE81DRAFT_323796 [Ceraceosorus guamensis]|uniref:S15/NS1 RNA-binding domain-containing protein n=1 Tax=Ceraceosorus guamensis TaxID=1522189 RepID=A0A316VX04_9BASI|nr:hypothetical protein IE81DRAFT_323796 [Ceraceosorus guamensis]PWN42146.1 hypothetical protein IE81DRAFT_323796 [Ceraceosorus guamensis]